MNQQQEDADFRAFVVAVLLIFLGVALYLAAPQP